MENPWQGNELDAWHQDMSACNKCPHPDGCPIGARECDTEGEEEEDD